jgi:hypothetical protein
MGKTIVLIDRFVPPGAGVAERHAVRVAAPPARAFRALRAVDFSRSSTIRTLFRLRGLVPLAGPAPAVRLEDFVRHGFVRLAETPDAELVLGVVGQFWRPSGGLRPVAPGAFAGFDEPGYAKAAWNFHIAAAGSGSLLSTETRVVTTDPTAERMFRLYWLGVGPFSKLIRRRMLHQIRMAAEHG